MRGKYQKAYNEFVPQDFGAKVNARQISGVTMSAGSNMVFDPAGGFTSKMVGMAAKVSFAGPGGNDLGVVGTGQPGLFISNYISPTQVQVTATAAAGTPTTAKNIIFGTDDTLAYRALIQKIIDRGTGTISMRGASLLATAPETSANGVTAQLIVPNIQYQSNKIGGIKFKGTKEFCYTDNGPRSADLIPPKIDYNGESMFDGFVSLATTNTARAAVLAMDRASVIDFNVNNFVIDKMKILAPTNGGYNFTLNQYGQGMGIGALNLEWAGNYQIEDFISNIDLPLPFSVQPTNGAIGIILNNLNSDSMNYINKIESYGALYGYELKPEHLTCGTIAALGCGTGVLFKAARFRLEIQMLLLHWCMNQMEYQRYNVPGGGVMGGVDVTGNLEVEALGVAQHPVSFDPNWLGTVNPTGLMKDIQHECMGQFVGGVQSGTSVTIDSGSSHLGFRIISGAALANT